MSTSTLTHKETLGTQTFDVYRVLTSAMPRGSFSSHVLHSINGHTVTQDEWLEQIAEARCDYPLTEVTIDWPPLTPPKPHRHPHREKPGHEPVMPQT